MLVGNSFLSLKNLSYMVENKMNCKILSSEGAKGIRGGVNIGYWPCAENGVDEPEDDVFCDEPHELVGKKVNFKVEINDAEDLPADLCKNSYVTYSLKYEPDTVYQTEKCDGLNQKPSFNYGKVHSVDCVSDYIIEYFQSSSVTYTFDQLISGLDWIPSLGRAHPRVPRRKEDQPRGPRPSQEGCYAQKRQAKGRPCREKDRRHRH